MHRRGCVCAHLHRYTCTNTYRVCFDSWDKEESSITDFICLCLTPFLPFPGCFCLGHFQHAHLILAIRNGVFLTVTTKDIACPPTIPPTAHPPRAAAPRSRFASPQPPLLPMLSGGSLHPHSTSTCPLPQAFLLLPQQEKR